MKNKRAERSRVVFTGQIGLDFRTSAAVHHVAEITKQNKKDAANALIWEALSNHPELLARVVAELPPLEALEPANHSTIEWGKDAAGMTQAEKDAVLANAERQSFRLADILVRLDEQKAGVR